MQTFKDMAGATHTINITIGALHKVKAETGVDLLDIFHAERSAACLDAINSNPFLLCDIIYSATSTTLSKEQFAGVFDGDAVEAATEALLNAITDFSRRHQRPLMAKVLQKIKQVEQKGTEAAMAILDDPKMDQMLESILKSGLSSTESLESSESTPTHSPSVS
jgi:hypothetical protein